MAPRAVVLALVVCGLTLVTAHSTPEAIEWRHGPLHIHLATGHNPSEMTVSWVSYNNHTTPLIRYGTSQTPLLSQVPDVTSFQMSTIPLNTTEGFVVYQSGLIRHAHLTGLLADTQYYYQIHESSDLSELLSFTTLPAVGAFPLTLIAMGDLGQTDDSRQTVARALLDSDARLILHAGDMPYSDCDLPRWESYFTMIEPLSQRLPWMVVAGNHEIEPNGFTGHIMDPYKHWFRMPQVSPGIDTTEYYQTLGAEGWDCTPSAFTGSYDFGNSFYTSIQGPARIFFLNSFTRTDNSSAQYKWLANTLQTVDRSVTPWLIGMWHSPWYNSNTAHQAEFNTLAMRASMEPLLLEHGVNIVLNGHVHAYERTLPVALGEVDSRGIVYIKIGDGGNREGHAQKFLPTPQWSAFRNGLSFGHGKLELVSPTEARWTWISNDALGVGVWGPEDEVVIHNVHALSGWRHRGYQLLRTARRQVSKILSPIEAT